MSISATATQSALRLGPPTPTLESMIDTASEAAAEATAASGASTAGAVEAGRDAVRQQTADGAAPPPETPLSQLVTYIPTETLTVYIAVLAALGDVQTPAGGTVSGSDFTSRWTVLAVMTLATAALTVGLSYRAQKQAGAEHPRFPVFEFLATPAAFVVWALSLDSSPLRDFAWFDYNAWSSVLILVGSITISSTAYVLGKTVTWQKVPGTGVR